MRKMLIFILFIACQMAPAQEIEIAEILDANLFKTVDGRLIRLANLEVPSLSDPDSSRFLLARNIVRFSESELLRYKCRFQLSPKTDCSEKGIASGHLFKIFPLEELNINKRYLENGYGVYMPCDTLYMTEYRKAGKRAMKKKLGIWKTGRRQRKPDYFNRMRGSYWILNAEYKVKNYFPIFGINYRWSNIYPIYSKNDFHLNFSGEAGTFVYFALPYAELGVEARFRQLYARTHYDAVIPFFLFVDSDRLNSYTFWGLDLGFMLKTGERSGLEIEYNMKDIGYRRLDLFSISFVTY